METTKHITTILNDKGEEVTRINVMRLFTYEVESIVQQLREDNRVGDSDELELTFDDIMERIEYIAEEDFNSQFKVRELLFSDEHGNDY
jgi:hypothetical protein